MAYMWALGNGEIVEATYNAQTDSLTNDQVRDELVSALQQFGHTVSCTRVNDSYNEVYSVIIDGNAENELVICIKGTTPGGRSNLNDEQRIQQKSKHINYAFMQHEMGKKAAHLGVYKRDDQVIFCAWKLKQSSAAAETPISKQIKIQSIADAMKLGFVQQEKGGGELACAFRKEFIYFYLQNIEWFHNAPVREMATHGLPEIGTEDEPEFVMGKNILLYGVPGCGKSHKIKEEYCDDETRMERVVFHPDYTYSDFIGQIMPTNVNGHISYPFIPGPFTRILRKAHEHPDTTYYLIIEEVNRGNAPAIFGEVFQLLDRVNGESEYGISNSDIAREVYGDENRKVKIPSNLILIATMNTADQNVFTLDTAFKRRWSMMSIENDIAACRFAGAYVCDSQITWYSFAETINSMIIDFGEGNLGSEDTRLGAYFVSETELRDRGAFAEKVLMYLWNDAFKYDHERVFKPQYNTLEKLIRGFKEVLFGVFLDTVTFIPHPVANITTTVEINPTTNDTGAEENGEQ